MDGSGASLSIATAMIGLLGVGGRAIDTLWDLNTAPKDLTAIINQALHGVRECRSSIHVLYKTLLLLQSSQLAIPERATWIEVDELLATLTDTVLAFSKLDALCEVLVGEAALSSPEEACERHAKKIKTLSARIRFNNLSMTMILTILKCPGQNDAKRSRAELAHRITRLLTFNTSLATRLRCLNGFGAAKSRPGSASPIAVPAPTAQTGGSGLASGLGTACLGSDVGRPSCGWSILSGLTLVNLPSLFDLNLPVLLSELRDSTQFYAFAFTPQVGGQVAETVLGPGSEPRSSHSSILGLSGESWDTSGMVNITREVISREY